MSGSGPREGAGEAGAGAQHMETALSWPGAGGSPAAGERGTSWGTQGQSGD